MGARESESESEGETETALKKEKVCVCLHACVRASVHACDLYTEGEREREREQKRKSERERARERKGKRERERERSRARENVSERKGEREKFLRVRIPMVVQYFSILRLVDHSQSVYLLVDVSVYMCLNVSFSQSFYLTVCLSYN